MFKELKKVVVIGGGTGTYTVLSGLKRYPPDALDLTAVVTVADSGGSTGRLRDEFGYLPVGDFRMALAALADANESGNLLRELFLYRFSKGGDLCGHNFGNLFLVAMTDILGSEEEAIAFASKVLRVRGKVLPVTTEHVTLVARYEDGSIVRGETHIDEPETDRQREMRITKLWVEPAATVSPHARDAIAEADLIILGPGDMYTSLLANVVIDGVSDAIARSPGKLLYIPNLMTKLGQTGSFTVKDHVDEVTLYAKRHPDYVLINNTRPPEEVLEKYAAEGEFPVADDLGDSTAATKILRRDLLASEEVVKPSGDVLKRSLVRHDSDKLALAIIDLT